MQKPNIEIKNYKTHGGREGIGFNLDLHINGIKCYHVRNDANGGCYSYYSYAPNNPKAEEIKTNIKLLDEYVATLEEKFGPGRSVPAERVRAGYRQRCWTKVRTA